MNEKTARLLRKVSPPRYRRKVKRAWARLPWPERAIARAQAWKALAAQRLAREVLDGRPR